MDLHKELSHAIPVVEPSERLFHRIQEECMTLEADARVELDAWELKSLHNPHLVARWIWAVGVVVAVGSAGAFLQAFARETKKPTAIAQHIIKR